MSNEIYIQSFNDKVIRPLKNSFVGKDEIIDLLAVCMIARENCFIHGPPGTAKSAIVQKLSQLIGGQSFNYLLTRFTEPNELFGPFDIRELREGNLVTNTEGMLPDADFVFLDELLNANSAILNSLLMALNERVFRRGRETKKLPALLFVGASNNLPEDDALAALFDRFIIRVHCPNVEEEHLGAVIDAGWQLEYSEQEQQGFEISHLRHLQAAIQHIDIKNIQDEYTALIHRLRKVGVEISDRRAVKCLRIIAASALLCNREQAITSDLWVMKYIWDTREQEEILAQVVQEIIQKDSNTPAMHPRAQMSSAPNADSISTDLESISKDIEESDASDTLDHSVIEDRLALIGERCQWLSDVGQRETLTNTVQDLWKKIRA